MTYINVGEMCFIPMNVHNELVNGVRQLRWQHLSPVVSTLSINIISQAFMLIFHDRLHPSFSFFLYVVLHPVFLISGLSLRFGDVDVFFLQSKVLCSLTLSLSSDHFHTDAVVVIAARRQYCHLAIPTASRQ